MWFLGTQDVHHHPWHHLCGWQRPGTSQETHQPRGGGALLWKADCSWGHGMPWLLGHDVFFFLWLVGRLEHFYFSIYWEQYCLVVWNMNFMFPYIYNCVTAGARTDRTLGFYPQRIAYSASTPWAMACGHDEMESDQEWWCTLRTDYTLCWSDSKDKMHLVLRCSFNELSLKSWSLL